MITKVRTMRLSDIDAVSAIENTAHRAPWSRDILADCVRVGYDCRVIERTENGKTEMVGYLITRFIGESAHLLNICIANEWQGKGYGPMFLKHFINTMKKRPGVRDIILEVRPSNPAALHMYAKFGFEQAEVKVGYYNDIQGIEDALLLRKVLD